MSALTKTPELSIVIPAYNESQRITPTLEAIDRFVPTLAMRYEIIVVDDGSRDDTAVVVEQLAARIPHLRVIRSTPNRGKGSAVRIGMLAARGQIRLMCDADGSMPATEMPRLLRPILRGEADIAIGSRYAPGAHSDIKQPKYRVLWSRLCNQVIQRTLVPGVRDTQCGFKAFTADAAERLFAVATIDGWAFDLEVLAIAKRTNQQVAEVGVKWTDDRRSRVNPLKDMWKVMREAVIIRRNLSRGAYGALPAAA